MPDSDHQTIDAPFRLAMRKEGEFVNAYLAYTDTMQDALLLGSIRLTLVQYGELWDIWKDTMKQMFAAVISDTLNVDVMSMSEHKAPESDRSGNA